MLRQQKNKEQAREYKGVVGVVAVAVVVVVALLYGLGWDVTIFRGSSLKNVSNHIVPNGTFSPFPRYISCAVADWR